MAASPVVGSAYTRELRFWITTTHITELASAIALGLDRIRMHILDFVLARLADDERVAEQAAEFGSHWRTGTLWLDWPNGEEVVSWNPDWNGVESYDPARPMTYDSGRSTVVHDEGSPTTSEAAHIARWDPARVLAEVRMKRALVANAISEAGRIDSEWGDAYIPRDLQATLSVLAHPYVEHPDFDQAWLAER